MYHNKQIHIFTVWEWLTSQIKRSVLYWPAGCSVHPASRRRASSQRSPIRPSDLWCQRSGTWQAQGGLWLGSTWTSGLRPTATESHSRIQLTGEAQSPSLAEERKEKGQQDGEEGTESEAWVKLLDESCVVKKKKKHGNHCAMLETERSRGYHPGSSRWHSEKRSIRQLAALSFQHSITPLLTLLLIYITKPQTSSMHR